MILGNRTFNSGHNVTINRSIINGDVGDPETLAVYNADALFSKLKHLELEHITASLPNLKQLPERQVTLFITSMHKGMHSINLKV